MWRLPKSNDKFVIAQASSFLFEYLFKVNTQRVTNLSQNTVLKKILKNLQAVKTSGLTNLHIVYLATSNCLDSQKKQIW